MDFKFILSQSSKTEDAWSLDKCFDLLTSSVPHRLSAKFRQSCQAMRLRIKHNSNIQALNPGPEVGGRVPISWSHMQTLILNNFANLVARSRYSCSGLFPGIYSSGRSVIQCCPCVFVINGVYVEYAKDNQFLQMSTREDIWNMYQIFVPLSRMILVW